MKASPVLRLCNLISKSGIFDVVQYVICKMSLASVSKICLEAKYLYAIQI